MPDSSEWMCSMEIRVSVAVDTGKLGREKEVLPAGGIRRRMVLSIFDMMGYFL